MSDQPPPSQPSDPNKPITQQFSHQSVAARVPERVAKGVYCTGQLVLDSPKEFVIDFLQGLTRPYQVVARVVVTPQTMAELAHAFKQNLDNYTTTFGPPPTLPPPPQNQRPTIQEIYDNFKVPDEVASGSYANTVLIGHSMTEFFFDFITGFYPNSAVSSRVFLTAAQAPRFLNTLNTALSQYQARYQQGQQQHQQQRPPEPGPRENPGPT
jgi:hypothetical protein